MNKDTENSDLNIFFKKEPIPRLYKNSEGVIKGQTSLKSYPKPVNKFDVLDLDVYDFEFKTKIQEAKPEEYYYYFALKLAQIARSEVPKCLNYHYEYYLNKGGNPLVFFDTIELDILDCFKDEIFVKGKPFFCSDFRTQITPLNIEQNYKSGLKWIEEKKKELKRIDSAEVFKDEVMAGLALGRQASSILFYYLRRTKVVKSTCSDTKIGEAVEILTGHSANRVRQDLAGNGIEVISSKRNLEDVLNALNSISALLKTEINKRI